MRRLCVSVFVISISMVMLGHAGTWVDNFDFKTQPEFDFRIGILKTWDWQGVDSSEPEDEKWLLSNRSKVDDSDHLSSAELTFISGFPADNEEELLAAVQKIHPDLKWTASSKDEYPRVVSEQVHIEPGRTRNFEYYFSSKNKVVRIEAIRDRIKNGAAELDTILSTIRRPGGAPRLVSVTMIDKERTSVEVGDQVCYNLEVDLFRNDFDSSSLSRFDVRGAPEHWSFKDVVWDPETSSFQVCLTVNQGFGKDGLVIEEIDLSTSGDMSLTCENEGVGQDYRLSCSDDSSGRVTYSVPLVNNPNPVRSAPVVKSLEVGATPHSVRIVVQSVLPIEVGEITVDVAVDSKKLSQVIYTDQISGSVIEVEFDKERLPSGFTRVMKLMLSDQVGNRVILHALSGEGNYWLYRADQEPVDSQIPVISLEGGE